MEELNVARWHVGTGRTALEMIIRILRGGFESHSSAWNFLWEYV